jgi:hypothetical protein
MVRQRQNAPVAVITTVVLTGGRAMALARQFLISGGKCDEWAIGKQRPENAD